MFTRIHFILIAIIVVSVFLGCIEPTPTNAQSEGSSLSGVDVVFLVDQSGSMKESDPAGLRFQGLQFAVDWMARTILERDPEENHSFRTAVVDFGSRPRVVLEPIEIAPRSDQVWADESQFFKEKLASHNRSTLGGTDFEQAFQKARDIFSLMNAEEKSDRTKAIILLTDGVPSPSPESKMDRLKNYVTSTFPYPEYEIYVVGLTSPESYPWSRWMDRWEKISHGNVEVVEDSSLLGSHFQEVLGEIAAALGVQGEKEITCGTIPISPYLDLARFTIHKPSKDTSVSVYDAQNRLVNKKSTEDLFQIGSQDIQIRGQQAPIESVSVYNPQPGMWRVECPASAGSAPIVFLRQVSAEGKIEVPSERLALSVPYLLTFRLFGHWGEPLGSYNDPRYALDVRVTGHPVDEKVKKIEDIVLQLDQSAQAYTGRFVPRNTGEYILHLRAHTVSPNGKGRLVVDKDLSPIKVMKPYVDVSVEESQVRQFSPITLKFALVDENGSPFVRTTDIMAALRARAIITEATQSVTVPLTATQTGLFVGSFLPYMADSYPVHAQVLLLKPMDSTSEVIAENHNSEFQVEPFRLETHIDDKEIEQLVPIQVKLTSMTKVDWLMEPENADLLQAEISNLGEGKTKIAELESTGREVLVTFTPTVLGEYTPRLTLLAKRSNSAESVVVAQKNLGPISVRSSADSENQAPEQEGKKTKTFAIVLIGVSVILCVVLAIVIIAHKRSRNESARGYVILEKPRGNCLDFINWGGKKKRKAVWKPQSMLELESGQEISSPVASIIITQTGDDAKDTSPGLRVSVSYPSGFSQYNDKWLDENNPLELKDGFWLTFSLSDPSHPSAIKDLWQPDLSSNQAPLNDSETKQTSSNISIRPTPATDNPEKRSDTQKSKSEPGNE